MFAFMQYAIKKKQLDVFRRTCEPSDFRKGFYGADWRGIGYFAGWVSIIVCDLAISLL